jgi:hypothetical protein
VAAVASAGSAGPTGCTRRRVAARAPRSAALEGWARRRGRTHHDRGHGLGHHRRPIPEHALAPGGADDRNRGRRCRCVRGRPSPARSSGRVGTDAGTDAGLGTRSRPGRQRDCAPQRHRRSDPITATVINADVGRTIVNGPVIHGTIGPVIDVVVTGGPVELDVAVTIGPVELVVAVVTGGPVIDVVVTIGPVELDVDVDVDVTLVLVLA